MWPNTRPISDTYKIIRCSESLIGINYELQMDCFDCVVTYRTLFFHKNYWKYVYFLYASFFARRMPTLSLWIFFKDLSVFKITEKCLICYYFLFRMYCVRTRFSLRLSSDQNFGKYVYMVNLLWVSYVAFPICLFESNWRNSHILSPRSFVIFTVLDLKSPISLPNKSQM